MDGDIVGLVLWVYCEVEDVAALTVCPSLGRTVPCVFSDGL